MLRRNVLIFHLGAIGDFVLTWPLAMALGRLFAQSRIIYVTHAQKGALAERALRVDSVDVESGGWHQLFSENPDLPAPARKLMEGAHSVLTFLARSEDRWMANTRLSAPEAELIRLDPRPPSDYRGHFTDFLVEQLGPWSAVQASVIAMLRSINERGIPITHRRSDRIVIHPGSGGEQKCWPRQRFIELIERLKSEGRSVRILLGEAELERWPADDVARFERIAEVARPRSLTELLTELASAAAVLANDSGPAHLAGVTGTPALVLFGPGNPTIWRPLGPRVSVIHQDLPTLGATVVYDRLIGLVGKP
jgi:ADP-heptose:LPS heptosyltransferase